MRTFVSSTLAAGILAASTLAAQAVTVSLTDTMTRDQNGETLSYSFTGLPTAASGDGLITISPISGAPPGIDIGNTVNEYMDVLVDGVNFGRWECGTPDDGGTQIPGAFGALESDCEFTLPITLPLAQLSSFIADGTLLVSLAMGSEVGGFLDDDVVQVTLTYPDVDPIPLPASLPLLAAGVGGLVLLRRRRRA